jgi:hypothetical protein
MRDWHKILRLDQLGASIKICDLLKQLEIWVGAEHGCYVMGAVVANSTVMEF